MKAVARAGFCLVFFRPCPFLFWGRWPHHPPLSSSGYALGDRRRPRASRVATIGHAVLLPALDHQVVLHGKRIASLRSPAEPPCENSRGDPGTSTGRKRSCDGGFERGRPTCSRASGSSLRCVRNPSFIVFLSILNCVCGLSPPCLLRLHTSPPPCRQPMLTLPLPPPPHTYTPLPLSPPLHHLQERERQLPSEEREREDVEPASPLAPPPRRDSSSPSRVSDAT